MMRLFYVLFFLFCVSCAGAPHPPTTPQELVILQTLGVLTKGIQNNDTGFVFCGEKGTNDEFTKSTLIIAAAKILRKSHTSIKQRRYDTEKVTFAKNGQKACILLPIKTIKTALQQVNATKTGLQKDGSFVECTIKKGQPHNQREVAAAALASSGLSEKGFIKEAETRKNKVGSLGAKSCARVFPRDPKTALEDIGVTVAGVQKDNSFVTCKVAGEDFQKSVDKLQKLVAKHFYESGRYDERMAKELTITSSTNRGKDKQVCLRVRRKIHYDAISQLGAEEVGTQEDGTFIACKVIASDTFTKTKNAVKASIKETLNVGRFFTVEFSEEFISTNNKHKSVCGRGTKTPAILSALEVLKTGLSGNSFVTCRNLSKSEEVQKTLALNSLIIRKMLFNEGSGKFSYKIAKNSTQRCVKVTYTP